MEIKLVSIKLEMFVHLICVKLVCFQSRLNKCMYIAVMRIIACNVDKYYKMIAHRSFATHHDQ